MIRYDNSIIIVFAGSTLHLNMAAYCVTYIILDAEVPVVFLTVSV